MKVSLKLKSGTKTEVENGSVLITGGCVVLFEVDANFGCRTKLAYCLAPGEIVRMEGEGDYIVEF